MDNKNQENSGFSYTYSAKEQEELKKIRAKYEKKPEQEDKLTRLRRLDASVTQTAQIAAITLGVIGALILGFGMSLCMTDLADMLNMGHITAMVVGVIVGVIGGVIASLAYPLYNLIVRIKREQIAPEIIRLADDLLK